jgi:hypothetical protein
LEVLPRSVTSSDVRESEQIQALFRRIAEDDSRNRTIVEDATAAYRASRHLVIMSERTDGSRNYYALPFQTSSCCTGGWSNASGVTRSSA